MPRPEKYTDLSTTLNQIGTIDLSIIADSPRLLSATAELIRATEEGGGKTSKSYATLTLSLPKTDAELKTELAGAQSTWDRRMKKYDEWVNDRNFPEHDWERSDIVRFATVEGLPDPRTAADKPADLPAPSLTIT